MSNPENLGKWALRKDIMGQRFGNLVAIWPTRNSRHGWFWLCQCDCQEQTEVCISHLLKPNFTRSCGCARRNRAEKTEVVCPQCKNVFIMQSSHLRARLKAKKGSKQVFCSLVCYRESHKSTLFSKFGHFLRQARNGFKSNEKKMVTITVQDLYEQWVKQSGKCAYTGIQMPFPHDYNLRLENSLKTASLDRIDSSRGYVKGNIQFVCIPINYAKTDYGDTEFKEFIRNIDPSYSLNFIDLFKIEEGRVLANI